MSLRDEFLKVLIADEGIRNLPYPDSKGHQTIGVGHNLEKPISNRAIYVILDDDVADAFADLDRELPWWKAMGWQRQIVLASMCFNMGIAKLLEFHKALPAMQSGDYLTASEEMKDSDWYREIGPRAERLCVMMRDGK